MSTGSKPIFVFPFCLFVCLYLGKVAVKLETIDILITFHLCSSQEIMKSSWKFTKTETEAPQNFRKVKNEKEKKNNTHFKENMYEHGLKTDAWRQAYLGYFTLL